MTVAVFILSLLGAMALGMPIAFALIVCGVALMLHLGIFDPQIIAQNMSNGANSFPLMAVPFFMLAGEFMNAGGMSQRIVNVAMAWSATSAAAWATSRSSPPSSWRRCPVRRSPIRRRWPRC